MGKTELSVATPNKNGHVSHWMVNSHSIEYPKFEKDSQYDVCVVGGGYTGLWTAYHLKKISPDVRVAVLEAKTIGYGASGRNGGWLSHLLPGSATKYAQTSAGGKAAVRRLQRVLVQAVDDVLQICENEGIEADQLKVGNLVVARHPAALSRLQARFKSDLDHGLNEDEIRLLNKEESQKIVNVNDSIGALYTTPPARVDPAKLVRGLGELCTKMGIHIYEHSPVIEIKNGVAITRAGRINAETILLCTEAYSHEFPIVGYRNKVISVNSSMIVTSKLPSKAWESIGWENFALFSDAAHAFTYAQRTSDNRIAIGGRGIPYRYNSGTGAEGITSVKTSTMLAQRLKTYFPDIDFEVDHLWSGSLGVSRDWCADVSLDPKRNVGVASGYAGHGVTATYLAGLILAEKTIYGSSQYDDLPIVNHKQPNWEPEPLRWIGITGTYKLFEVADIFEQRFQLSKTSWLARIATKISGL